MSKSSAQPKFTLPELPLNEWIDTKLTLHLFMQIVGKIRMMLSPDHNHWWHVTYYVTPRGVRTSPIPFQGRLFEIAFDFTSHQVDISTSDNRQKAISLNGQSVGDFYRELMDTLGSLDIDVSINPQPFDVDSDMAFPEDSKHASYDRDAIKRYHQLLVFAHSCLYEFSSGFLGKKTPVHLFWHSFDLALTFFSGKSVPIREGAGRVEAEAYSHEVISFGFYVGDDKFPAPAFYSYTHPEPANLREQPLAPGAAEWIEQGGGSLAVLPYVKIRSESDPKDAVLEFCESAYLAGARLNQWKLEELRYQPMK